MAKRHRRSVSLPPELDKEIQAAAGTTVSAWLAATAAHRLRLEAGRRAIVEWDADRGALTAEELADGLALARSLPGRTPSTA